MWSQRPDFNIRPPSTKMEPVSEQRTAHHVRRLHDSIHDLQNALGVVAKTERPQRPPRDTITPDTAATEDPMSRITANNQRGFVQHIERIQGIGAVVLGLEGVGALVADALCRYGVKRLIVGDNSEIQRGDLDFMGYYVQDVGRARDDLAAASARELNPEIHVFPLGLPLANAAVVVESLRKMLTLRVDDDSEDEDGDASSDDDVSTGDISESSASDDSCGDEGCHSAHHVESSAKNEKKSDRGSHYQHQYEEPCFRVVFLCGQFPDLAMQLNELCCEFGVQLVYVAMGKNGLSGDTLSVVPGHSACLQCLEKRKMLKIAGSVSSTPPSAGEDGVATAADVKVSYNAGLPTTECVLAGIAVQHAMAHLLGAGSICSRVEYDGFLEELDRSGFIAPVHQCPSAHCRQQQQQHSLPHTSVPTPAV